jgi:hypothetical protein
MADSYERRKQALLDQASQATIKITVIAPK